MRRKTHLLLFCFQSLALICLLFIAHTNLLARENPSANVIHLKSGDIVPAANASAWFDSMTQIHQASPVQVLLQFNTIPTAEQRTLLAENGITLYDYVPENAFIAIVRFPLNASNISSVAINTIIPVRAEWKADNYIWKNVDKNINNNIEVLFSFYDNIDKETIINFLSVSGAQIEHDNLEDFGNYKVQLPASRLRSVAQWYGLKYISPVNTNTPLDVLAKAATKVNVVARPYSFGGYNLLGDSVTVGIGDNTTGFFHIDMKDRITNYNPAPLTDHGLHINGIVASAGIVDPYAEGASFHSKIVDHYFNGVLAYTGVMNKVHNMTITNNSYVVLEGDCNYSGTYDAYAQFVDNLAIQYKSILHVFAAGNDGNLNCTPYPQFFGTTCGGYQPSKNSLCVTSIATDYFRPTNASAGPVKDGRLKPEMCAVGFHVYSCVRETDYIYADGTSMASPGVASAASLLTQRYKQLHSGVTPRADLLKAIILNGTQDIGNPGPDYMFGFGFLDLYRSMDILNNGHYINNVISNGGNKTLAITVPPNTAAVKVMLYWCDAATSPLSSTALVNDLDLTVIDPASGIHKPLVLDPTPANVNNLATEKADHLNNCEQVTITKPQAGSYTINVNGYNVPGIIQDYILAYDFIPDSIKLTSPVAGSVIPNGRYLNVCWEVPEADTNSFTLQYSKDNGANWNLISNNIPSTQHFLGWVPDTTINSAKCLLKFSENNSGKQTLSGPFVVARQDSIRLDSVQCPGNMAVYWDATPNATAYQVWRKRGPYMTVIDTVTTNNYVLHGLSLDSTYYVAVAPIVDGTAGYRSTAVWRQPNTGNCAGNYANGDLSIEKILAPGSGRLHTSIELSNNSSLVLKIRNQYATTCNSYILSYKINNGSWITDTPTLAIPANGYVVDSIHGLDLSATGNYKIIVAVTNNSVTDPVHQNDTAVENISQFVNDPIDLTNAFNDGFEGIGATSLSKNFVGVSSYWDYSTATDSGRLRTFVNDSILITGNRSVSLDAILNLSKSNQNYFTGTFNLSNYIPSNAEIRTGFDYELAGRPKTDTGNMVWVRGTDTSQWINLYTYNLSANPGKLNHSGSLSLSDAMLKNNQHFSTSTQIRFGQNDTCLIALRDYGNGMTIDNFSIYIVQNDVGLVRIVAPQQVDCGLGNLDSLTVLVRNGVNLAQHNVWLYYQVDGGAMNKDTLLAIAAKDSVFFTFKKPMDLSALGQHTINVWLSNTGDTYHLNDSILNYTIHNQPMVSTFPYLQNFEADNGNWYTDGINDSWQYGTPASPKINKAASGTKAWKTNLTGTYNNLEKSYLYSPCFDISGLANPMLSFSFAMELEDCGNVLCDAGYVEYSTDSINWTKLGATGQGTNWYDSSFNVWSQLNNTRWHVASIPLPHSLVPVRLRFVLASDPGASFEGMAIDDVHIFDRTYPVFNGSSSYYIQHNAGSNLWLDFTQPNGIFAQVQPNNQNLGDLNTTVYIHNDLANFDRTQYIFPKSFTIKTTQQPSDSVGVRLFVLDSDLLNVIHDTTCISCTKPADAYSLGVTKYDNINTDLENGKMDDNIGGTYTYYPHSAVKWVPYDRGYYAEIKLKSFSELWLNDGGPSGNFSAGTDYLVFNARKISATDVKIDWTSYIDATVNKYEVQRSLDDSTFTTIDSANALHQAAPQYTVTDAPPVSIGNYVYYRLKWLGLNNSVYYSPERRVIWTNPNELISVYPNPASGQFTINWTANTGTDLRISIMDAVGRIAFQASIPATEWNMSSVIKTPRFSTGIYFLRIAIADKQYLEKMMFY